jgi:hypothetical protein
VHVTRVLQNVVEQGEVVEGADRFSGVLCNDRGFRLVVIATADGPR